MPVIKSTLVGANAVTESRARRLMLSIQLPAFYATTGAIPLCFYFLMPALWRALTVPPPWKDGMPVLSTIEFAFIEFVTLCLGTALLIKLFTLFHGLFEKASGSKPPFWMNALVIFLPIMAVFLSVCIGLLWVILFATTPIMMIFSLSSPAYAGIITGLTSLPFFTALLVSGILNR